MPLSLGYCPGCGCCWGGWRGEGETLDDEDVEVKSSTRCVRLFDRRPATNGQDSWVDLAPMRPSSSTSSVGDAVDQLVKESVATLSRAKRPPVDLPVTSIAESGAKIAQHYKVFL